MALARFLGSTWSITPEGGTLTPILGVYSCSLQGGTADEDDITVAADTVMHMRQGLADPGSYTLNIRRKFSDPGQIALLTMWTAGQKGLLTWTLPLGAGSLSMNVFVQSMPPGVNLGSHVMTAVTFKITGEVTINA